MRNGLTLFENSSKTLSRVSLRGRLNLKSLRSAAETYSTQGSVVMTRVTPHAGRIASWNGPFQTLFACDTLTVDRREVTIEAGPQLANRGRRRISHRSVELGIP